MTNNKEEKRVLVAFSGGIDSCQAVKILRNQGYNPEALTIDMLSDQNLMAQAIQSAQKLDLKLHIINAQQQFKKLIIDDFISEYMSGRTPAPCTKCNTHIKWEILAKKADELQIHNIATGHYFNICNHQNGLKYITKAEDKNKDQSYYLWGVPQEILQRVLTPMATEIKAIIKENSHIQKESMGICFLKGKHYTEYICDNCAETMPSGDIVDRKGNILGKHNGIARYTIGQKKGQGIPHGERVVKIDSSKNQIVVDKNSTLFTTNIQIEQMVYSDPEELQKTKELQIMVRGLGINPTGYATLQFTSKTTATISLQNPAWAIAPGQPIALYIGDRVVGGGYQVVTQE